MHNGWADNKKTSHIFPSSDALLSSDPNHYKIKWIITVSVRRIKRHLRIGVKVVHTHLKQT